MKSKNFKNLIQILIFSSTILIQTGCDKTEENKLPICTITSPSNGVEIVQGETVTISVNANDIDGSVSEVRFYIDGSDIGSTINSPYNFDWETSDQEIGTHSIKAIAKDNSGSVVYDEIEISLIPEPVTDFDGNIYSTVKIGTQIWMAENLKTTKYNDGTAIPLVTDNTAWTDLTTPGYCWYNNDEVTYKNPYGALYNWYTVNTSKLCPTGWHVPSDAEWTQLIDYLGGRSGGKLKETGTTHWNSPNTGATNESGFTGLPGGGRGSGFSATFYTLGNYGNYWLATEANSSNAWSRILYYNFAGVLPVSAYKTVGHSVRCLKDN